MVCGDSDDGKMCHLYHSTRTNDTQFSMAASNVAPPVPAKTHLKTRETKTSKESNFKAEHHVHSPACAVAHLFLCCVRYQVFSPYE